MSETSTQTERELRRALEESVALQSHYADLLNALDNGHRRIFINADAWLKRLRETKGPIQ